MCGIDPVKESEESKQRKEAKRRAEIAQKCDVLKVIDREIELGGAIYDVLRRALCDADKFNAGAGDTIKKLLALEGYKA
jgi:hypothetical protein